MLIDWAFLHLNVSLLEDRYCVFPFRHSPASGMGDEPVALHLALSLFQRCQSLKPIVSTECKRKNILVFTISIWRGISGNRGHLTLWNVQEKNYTWLWDIPLELWSYFGKWKMITLEVPWKFSKVYRNHKLLNVTILSGNVKSEACKLVELVSKQNWPAWPWQKGPTWQGDNCLTYGWFQQTWHQSTWFINNTVFNIVLLLYL